MDEKNKILENTSEKEKEEDKSFLKKIKEFLKEEKILSKLIVTIPAIYAAIYFMQNIFYKFTCENLYGIPAEYFRSQYFSYISSCCGNRNVCLCI